MVLDRLDDQRCAHCGLQLHRCGSCHGVAGPFDRYCGFCGHELVRGEERAPYWRLWMLAGLESIQHRPLRSLAGHIQLDGPARARERLQVARQHDLYHFRVCTSTESTPGRSRTTAFQLVPSSADAYTWPPLVPK